jgi:transcriptional regulator with XRE-family HTH domain
MSQQDLANRASIATSTLQKIERAETKDPGFFTVTRLAAELALTLSELTGDDE